MKKFFLLLFLGISLASCIFSDNTEEKIAQIPMHVQVVRFDSLFFHTPFEKLPLLEKQFPYLFPTPATDTLWQNRKHDTIQIELYQETAKAFASFTKQKEEIKSVYQHIKHYFPAFEPAKVITLVSDVDYQHKVIYADSLLLIGIDNYLGKNHHFYEGFHQYIKSEFSPEYFKNDIASAIALTLVPATRSTVFLDRMIYHGKWLYLAGLFMGNPSEEYLLKYEGEKYAWAVANESEIWRYFIEKELLYSTDKKTLNRFLDPAPFSKFYMEFDNQSPGGVGAFIGLQIVKAYMQKHPNNLPTMLKAKAENIFKEANYKPKK